MNIDGFFLTNDESSTFSITKRIINKGIELELFSLEIDVNQYIQYFIHNTVYLFINKHCNEDIVRYIMSPLLTEIGMNIMKDINLTSFFEVTSLSKLENLQRNFVRV
jgi:hypothetical protein